MPPQTFLHVGFFYDAAQRGVCGCGVWLRISENSHYKLHWHGGMGTNSWVETVAIENCASYPCLRRLKNSYR